MFSTIDKITLAFIALACATFIVGMGLVLWQRYCTDRYLNKIKPMRRLDKRWRNF